MANKAVPGRKGDPWWAVVIEADGDRRVVVNRYRTSGNAAFGAIRRAYNLEPEPRDMVVTITRCQNKPRTMAAAEFHRRMKRLHGATH